MLLMINSVAIAEALQKLLPVIAICRSHENNG
jgi:gamma-glutamyl-gamma-aminobutyrate hydrolase PuuD